jgi:DNA-binding Lrp family transcriptional regulator
MSILRGTLPSDSFTIIPNAWLRDPALSAKAKGILCYIASHAQGYELSFRQMQKEMSDGETALRTGLAELEESGYLTRVRTRDEAGRLGVYEYALGDVPAAQIQTGKSSLDDAKLEDHATKKTTEKKTTERIPSASPRGARLPDDWKPGQVLMSWYQVTVLKGLPWSDESRAACRHEHEKFRDHWLAAAGASARKRDWDAAWRNWMRRAFERKSPTASPVSAPPSPKPFVQQADEYKAEQARRKRVFAEAVDAVLDAAKEAGVKIATSRAVEIVNEMVESGQINLDSPNELSTHAPMLYSGLQDVITVDVEEVTGS